MKFFLKKKIPKKIWKVSKVMKALITKIEGLKLSPTFKDKTGKKKKSYDSLPPKYTTFHHLVYVARWSPTLIYF
jgi:hypothetical protein